MVRNCSTMLHKFNQAGDLKHRGGKGVQRHGKWCWQTLEMNYDLR